MMLNSGKPVNFDRKGIPNEHCPGVNIIGNSKAQEVLKKRPVSKSLLRVRQNHLKAHTTPKRRRSSSSSSSYDSSRFVSRNAARRYAKTYIKKSIIPERGFSGVLKETIAPYGWHEFVSHPMEAIIPLVREFYANAKERKDSKVFVRGKWVPFDRNTINKIYNISETLDKEYEDLCQGRVDPKDIIRAITYRSTQWIHSSGEVLHFPQSGLLPECKAWHDLISTKLLPSKNLDKVHKELAIINYAIKRHLPINVGKIIECNFEHTLKGFKSSGLPYPSLITRLCLKAGVEVLDTDECMQPIDVIDEASLARYKSPMIDLCVLDDAAEPSAPTLEIKSCDQHASEVELDLSDAPAPEKKSCDTSELSTLQRQMSELRRSVDEMRAHQQQMFEYQVQFNTAMAVKPQLLPAPLIFSSVAAPASETSHDVFLSPD